VLGSQVVKNSQQFNLTMPINLEKQVIMDVHKSDLNNHVLCWVSSHG
jgi:predicted amino acid dehydrogenase